MENEILGQIKRCTAPVHRRVESQLGFLLLPTVSIVELRLLFLALFDFIVPQENLLLEYWRNDSWLKAISYAERLRRSVLADDLKRLGEDVFDVKHEERIHPQLPLLQTAAQRLGYLYVIEGSSLGGSMINRNLVASLGLEGRTSLQYFSIYGADLGRRWQVFTQTLVAFCEANVSERELVYHAAQDTFEKLSLFLADRVKLRL